MEIVISEISFIVATLESTFLQIMTCFTLEILENEHINNTIIHFIEAALYYKFTS